MKARLLFIIFHKTNNNITVIFSIYYNYSTPI
jgi:hypothetical protein